tara:strand:- start:8035 stop:9705 length:1671 start_codon:yes stop_codon:yes gene_type:complete
MSKEIQLITLSKYVRPQLTENKSKNWVMNGKNNSFYQDVIDRYNGSPTNAAIINSYVDLIYGRGLYASNAVSNVNDWTKLRSILKAKELRKIISDYQLFNEFSFQVIEKRGGDLASITHVPKERVIPSIENDNEEIESYWYSRDWSKQYKPENKPEEIPSFNGKKQKNSIYVGKPYKAGKNYFSDPEYLAGMPYATMEEEIANLYVNSIKNGLSAGYIINVPEGINWTPEEKEQFTKDIKAKLTGSPNASKFVISFNGVEKEVTISAIPINENVHKQWEYLTQEARQQLLTAHGVTSPMLFGIKDNTGLGNNADELDTAFKMLMETKIRSKQSFILDALEEVLVLYGINLNLEFIPQRDIVEDEKETVELKKKSNDLDLFIGLGEDYDDHDEYMLVNESEVNYEEEEKIQLASTGTARPNAKSDQDNDDIVIRYRYVGNKSPEREFCRKMMSANKVYRKEDIIQMGDKLVNPGFGMAPFPNKPYSIWLHKGGGKLSYNFKGGTCKHKWNRVIYLKKGSSVDVNSPLAKIISTSEARRRGYKVETNDSRVSIAPHDM